MAYPEDCNKCGEVVASNGGCLKQKETCQSWLKWKAAQKSEVKMAVIDVWRIKRLTMSGSEYLKDAYTDEDASFLICENMNEEFVSYKPIKSRGEEISNDRIIIEDQVYNLKKMSKVEILFERAMKKLTDEEVRAISVVLGSRLAVK